jgi:hypothetical protein
LNAPGRAEIDTNALRGVIGQLKSLTHELEHLIPSASEEGLSNTEKIDYLCRSSNFRDAFSARDHQKKREKKQGSYLAGGWAPRARKKGGAK